jgi:3-hydroxyisobutyrate dehydrogenase
VQGIVTAAGRTSSFPLFLSSTTEQVLALGVSSDYGLLDDAQLTRVYLPSTPTLVLTQALSKPASGTPLSDAEKRKKLQLVQQVMSGVHLAAAAEAMSLGKKVGLDMQMLFKIIETAAGSSRAFVDRTPQILSGNWSSTKTVQDVVAELVSFLSLSLSIALSLQIAEEDGMLTESTIGRVNARSEPPQIPPPSHRHGTTAFPARGSERVGQGARYCSSEDLGW